MNVKIKVHPAYYLNEIIGRMDRKLHDLEDGSEAMMPKPKEASLSRLDNIYRVPINMIVLVHEEETAGITMIPVIMYDVDCLAMRLVEDMTY